MPVSNVLYPAELISHGPYWKISYTACHWLMKWWQPTLNAVSRYSDGGKSDICDKYTEYSAYASCLGYPSIRSPAAILSSVHQPIHRTDRRYSHSRSVGRVMSHHLFSQHDHCLMRALIALAYTRNRSAWYPQKKVVIGFEISCGKFSILGFFLTVVRLRLSAGFQKFCYS